MKDEPQSCVTLSAVVGLAEILQQTPKEETSHIVDIPPLSAEQPVISDTAVVIIPGKAVVKLT